MKLILIVGVEYHPNGEMPEALEERMKRVVDNLIGEGLLTGDGPATIKDYAFHIRLGPSSGPMGKIDLDGF